MNWNFEQYLKQHVIGEGNIQVNCTFAIVSIFGFVNIVNIAIVHHLYSVIEC